MKRNGRLLSGVLALSMCLSLISPAALADGGAAPAVDPAHGITAKFTTPTDWEPGETPTDRVWLDVDNNDVVVDSFTYTIASDKDGASAEGAKAADRYEIDQYGYITLKSGEKAISGEVLTVTAKVKYFDGENVIWADNVVDTSKRFENKSDATQSGNNYNYDYTISNQSAVIEGKTELPAQVARTGQYGITTNPNTKNGAPGHKIGSAGIVTAWYYDPVETDQPEMTVETDTQFGININSGMYDSAPNKFMMGIAALKHSSGNPTNPNTNYSYRKSVGNSSNGWASMEDNDGTRAEGWHKMQWVVDESAGLTMYFDEHLIYTDATTKSIEGVYIGANKGYRDTTQAIIQNRHFIDDISVVKNNVTPKSDTLTATITVKADDAPPVDPTDPVGAVLVGTDDLTPSGGTAKIRLDTANATDKKVVIGDINASNYSYDTNKLTIDENGVVSVKAGYTPQLSETVDVTVNYDYYSGEDVKYVENFDDNTAHPFKEEGTGTGYTINNGQSRTGLNGATFIASNTSKTDGSVVTLAQETTGNVVVTAWYYDPYEQADIDHAAFFPNGGKGQVKYGFGVSNGTTSTAHYSLGLFYSTREASRDGDPAHYGYRMAGGNFIGSNVSRSTGWHKLTWDINATEGTTRYIDDVKIDSDPIADIKSAKKLTLVTNWQNALTYEGRNLVQNRHYIDDISIVAKDAQAKQGTATVQVTIQPDPVPVITTQPADQTVTLGQSASFTVAATGAASYQWYSCDAQGNNGVIVPSENTSAKTATLTVTPDAEGKTYYYCTVTNAAGDVKSNMVTLTVLSNKARLTFGADDNGSLRKGETGRVYLDNMGSFAIKDVTYSTNNENVTVGKDGTLEVKAGYAPKADEKVTVTAEVTYYDKGEDIIFSDSFEGGKTFTDASGNVDNFYKHSTVNSLYGRKAATAVRFDDNSNGYPTHNIDSVSDVTVTAWYYDNAVRASQNKFGFSVCGSGNAMGVVYDGTTSKYVTPSTEDNYAARVSGFTYNDWSWGTSESPRSEGWHKFEWIVDSNTGLTMKIDGNILTTNRTVGKTTTDHTLVKAENIASIKELTSLVLLEGWTGNATNAAAISDKHFIDGVTVVKNTATTATMKLTSVEIPVLDIAYSHTPENITVDSTYPSDVTVLVKPDLTELQTVKIDGTLLDAAKWTAAYDGGPKNASNYPADMKGWKLTVDGAAFKGLKNDTHKLTLVMTSGSTYDIDFTAAANTHVPTNYYLSNSGNDTNGGNAPGDAWATFDKLSTVTFGPGDNIYLDAESMWSNVHFQPKGSGAPGAPIVMTKYNDGGNSSKRPILNGDGTVAARQWLTFTSHRKFYPSGTIELFNVEQWEIRGIEITNYKADYDQGATGRNGVAIIYDFMEALGYKKLPGTSNDDPVRQKAVEEEFYHAGKLQHIVVDDCYIHDVTGYHPNNGATGGGSKMSGGINAYGPYDDLKLNNNIVMYCDVEGIRNDVLAWRKDTDTQFPHYMEGIEVNNNFIVGIPGDGVVISSAIEPTIRNNYLADAGYSYFSDGSASGKKAKAMGNRDNPVIYRSANFAGLWFIGTLNAVAEYNESVNNVWTCNDGEAFDADMYCRGTVFQYNYTYKNNGGMALFMATQYNGTVVRYNVSVMDGEGIGSGTDQDATFHYAGTPEAIYNNLFILGDKVESIFGGGSNTAYFYNNIVLAPNGLLQPSGNLIGFHINGSSDGNTAQQNNPKLAGKMTNNLFYPTGILESVVTGSTVTLENNKTLTEEEYKALFHDLSGFLAAQPVKALNGRSTLTGTPVSMIQNKGTGVAMSAADGRSVKVPTGGFDYTQFEGIKTLEGSPAIGSGRAVTYDYQSKDTSGLHTLTKDFFENSLTGVTTPDIGPYQWSADPNHYVKLTFVDNGADSAVAAVFAPSGKAYALPAPTKADCTFGGWYINEALTGDAANSSYTVPENGITLYAKWKSQPGTFTVSFDSQGGSHINPLVNVASGTITAPSEPAREGYAFKGWYKEAACTTPWDFGVDTVAADTTLFAKWEAKRYTVAFDSNGGDTQADPQSVEVTYPATTVGELPTAPTRKGYSFKGWNTQADGQGTAFTATTPITENLTVYAQWEVIHYVYTVTFDKNGGNTEANPAIKTVSDPATTLGNLPTPPTKEGSAFAGWNTEPDGTGSVFTKDSKVTGDMTIYAQWKPVGAFTVTYDKNGGDTEASPAFQNVTPPATTVVSLPTPPTREGYTFTGWNTLKSGNGVPFAADTPVTGNLTVYAQWKVYEAPSSGGSAAKPLPNPNIEVTGTEGGKVNSKLNPNGSTTYTFAPEAGKEVLYVRVNGLLVDADSVTIPKNEAASIVAVFGDKDADYTQNYGDTADLPDYMADAVNYVVGAGLFQGVSADSFAPRENMSRAMFAVVLARLYGADTSDYSSRFSDVPDGTWYTGSVAWAYEMGFTSGAGANQFAPDRSMTREELVTLIYRFAQKVGVDVSKAGGLDAFPDAGSVNSWATDAMNWAVGLGLINGRGGMLAPTDTITRVEAAIILERMSTLLVKAK